MKRPGEHFVEPRIDWPEGKRFAFTIFDDTDLSSLDNGPRIYDFLRDAGLRTTKSVWPIKGDEVPRVGGTTCEDPEYLQWILDLREQGFEIAMHNATYHSSKREQAIRGLERFKELFGEYPGIHVNHADCEDSVYWGDVRLSGVNRLIYNLLTRFRNRDRFLGDVESSEYFWADMLKERVKYVRNFVFSDINTLKACPWMPYYDERLPFVNHWFASSEGATCESFCRTISEPNQDRLEEEGGACIMYVHFGYPDFYVDGKLNPEFARLIERLSRKDGWFVPVSTLLDHILEVRGPHSLTARQRKRLERKWLLEKIFVTRGGT